MYLAYWLKTQTQNNEGFEAIGSSNCLKKRFTRFFSKNFRDGKLWSLKVVRPDPWVGRSDTVSRAFDWPRVLAIPPMSASF